MRSIVVLAIAVSAAIAGTPSDEPSPSRSGPPPVVMVVFDALPAHLLQDGAGNIDARRFPNFAALARESSWFPNATTVSESTRFSVPAMLDGRAPRPKTQATLAAHPRNLFTIAARRYRRMNVWEEATELCPRSLCRRASGRGNVIARLRHGRVGRFRKAIRAIDGSAGQLSFIHVLLPHEPRQYLPSGRAYARARPSEPNLEPPEAFHRRFLVEHELQRTLLQLQYTDALLGELIGRMKRLGIWNRAMLVVTSDHGESFAVKRRPAGPFRVGELNWHRAVTRQNLQDVASVAMFVKQPGQRSGGTDDRFVRTTDLLPTILEAARLRKPAGLAGHSLRGKRFKGYRTIRVVRQDGRAVTMPRSRWLRRSRASRARRITLFGAGSRSLFDFGPRRELLGVSVADLVPAPRSKVRVRVNGARRFRNVRLTSAYIPALVSGWIRGGHAAGRTLAFALNGTVVATAPTYPPLGKTGVNFVALLPEHAFRAGRNELEVFEPDDARLRRLTPG